MIMIYNFSRYLEIRVVSCQIFAKPENDDRICYLKGKGNELPNISLVCNLQTTK